MPVNDPNLGVAFGLVIGAGMATALGAAIVFVPALAKRATRRVLASALGVSSGVMIYVSFVEIFQKANDAFLEGGYDENEAYLYATLCFFGGVITMVLLNYMVTAFLGGHHHHHHDPTHTQEVSNDESAGSATRAAAEAEAEVIAPCPCCTDDPQGDLDKLQHMAEEIDNYEHQHPHHHWEGKEAVEQEEQQEVAAAPDDGGDEEQVEAGSVEKVSSEGVEKESVHEQGVDGAAEKDKDNEQDDEEEEGDEKEKAESRKLMRMSINTALAIGLHNFPEGLATFVAALDDPRVGGVLAIAIAIHNVPEGLCVAMPIYYATGSRWKAFGWAVLSGVSEPIAALLGWAILANSFSDVTYAILFGIVAGMMVIISVRELLPTAHRYDPEDTVVTYSMIAGMAIMAISLVLFFF